MKESDVGRRCVVYDRPHGKGNGIVGTIIAVYSPTTFRFLSDANERYPNGKESEFSTAGNVAVRVDFLDGDY